MTPFFFSSRRRHTRQESVSWARRCVQETADGLPAVATYQVGGGVFSLRVVQNENNKVNIFAGTTEGQVYVIDPIAETMHDKFKGVIRIHENNYLTSILSVQLAAGGVTPSTFLLCSDSSGRISSWKFAQKKTFFSLFVLCVSFAFLFYTIHFVNAVSACTQCILQPLTDYNN
eukprot:TRINITY_DN11467_c0_g1_i7.p1 TRINITY_DN11467_c0_g1~~TRINITY_DN11467_c0_g1_i7.p1  ORF type:complete len:173 (-),score=35.62 TRINITY_DN11467_c0_g1_i7:104-622(-)